MHSWELIRFAWFRGWGNKVVVVTGGGSSSFCLVWNSWVIKILDFSLGKGRLFQMQVVGVLFGVVTVQNSYLLYVKDVIVNKSFYSSRNFVTFFSFFPPKCLPFCSFLACSSETCLMK